MNASVLFRWSRPDNRHYQGEGVTRDVSVAGAFILTATCPPPSAVVQVEVFLPLSKGRARALMQANMLVLRVEHDVAGAKRSGFSEVSKVFSLRTFSDRASRLVESLIKESEKSMESRK